jgi:ATP-dependent DNA ligase
MLCKRTEFDPSLYSDAAGSRADKIMKGQAFIIEDKLDGERMLLHKRGDEVEIFARKTTRYTRYATALAELVRSQVSSRRCHPPLSLPRCRR